MTKLSLAEQRKEKHKAFALEYLIDFNGTRAAIAVGVPPKGAPVTASRWLNKAHVQEILKAAIGDRDARLEDDGDAALAMVKAVADADPNALVEMRRGCCRYCHGQGGEYHYTKQEFAQVQERYEADKSAYERGMGSKPGAEPYPPLELKGGIGFNPNEKPHPECSECWGEGEIRSFIKDTRTLTDAERRLFAGVKETQHGVELKVNSQDKSRELLMRHHGLLNDRLGLGNPDGSPLNLPLNPAAMIVNFVSVAVKKEEAA